MSFDPLRLHIEDRGDTLEVRITGQYGKTVPTKADTRKAATEMLQAALSGIKKAQYGGSAEDDKKRVKRHSWLITKDES